MTGGSLGLRSSSSYGWLQQLQQVHSSSICSPPINSNRKNPKMQLLGSREKERWLSWICKFASSRKVGMFLLIVTSVAVILSFFFALSKDVDQASVPEIVVGYSDQVGKIVNRDRTSSNHLSPPPAFATEDNENTTSMFNIQHAIVDNETQAPIPFVYSMTIPPQHPCENFSLPPPPVDPKRTGPRPCDVCYVPVDLAMAYMPALPSVSSVIKNLDYVSEENLLVNESNGGSIFGGHPSLQQRDQSFDIKESMTVHCGFVKGRKPGQGTGFDIDEADLLEMEQCRGVVIASAIFGNYDIMQQPRNISEASMKTACFYMFVDRETEASIRNYTSLDNTRKVGLWRVVVVQNLPYVDARRNGKVPKLLLHRLFPNARFSLWIDGKLELVVDPYQILERFLWRHNASFAISRHYRRFDVFEEAEANKAAGKYDNSSIDSQIEFYKREGLTHYSPAKYPITSDVPEGCVIVREHTPITNLFTCLWFNEVDRFTSRDQLSFSTVRDRIVSKVNWTIHMFMDCERRNFVVQGYHRDILEQRLAGLLNHHPQPRSFKEVVREPIKEVAPATKSNPSRKQSRRRERKSGSSRKHRPRGAANIRDPNSF